MHNSVIIFALLCHHHENLTPEYSISPRKPLAVTPNLFLPGICPHQETKKADQHLPRFPCQWVVSWHATSQCGQKSAEDRWPLG